MQSHQLPRALDSSGNPLSGAKARFFLSGTTTPQAVFAAVDSDGVLSGSLGAVVTSDSAGNFPAEVYLTTTVAYRRWIETSTGTVLPDSDADPINTIDGSTGIENGDIVTGAVDARVLADGAIEDKLGYTPEPTIGYTTAKASDFVGMIAYFNSAAAPTNWLICNGAAPSRTTYAALWAWIQANGIIAVDGADHTANPGKFYTGDGSTTFTLPDFRGEFVRNADAGRGVDTGRTVGTEQAEDLKSHTHAVQVFNGSTGIGTKAQTAANTAGADLTTGATGGTETRPRNVALLACIHT